MADEKKRPQLHFSHIDCLVRCGEQFRRIYLCGERRPPGVALLVGSAVHKSVERDLKNKVADGVLLPAEAIQETARDALKARWNEEGVQLSEAEAFDGIEKTQGACIDTSVALALLHHAEIAPAVRVTSEDDIERPFVIDTSGKYPFDISGTVDIREHAEGGAVIRDTKTKKSSPPKNIADVSLQLTVYAMAEKIITGEAPSRVCFDFLIKTKTPKALSISSTRTEADFDVFLRRFEQYCKTIESGVFLPADPSGWMCSPEWCGFYDSCPYAKGRVQG